MVGQVRIFAFVTVFIAVFMLFYIFDSLQKIAKRCSVERIDVCKKLKGFSMPVIIVLLLVGVLSLIVCSTAYVVLTFK